MTYEDTVRKALTDLRPGRIHTRDLKRCVMCEAGTHPSTKARCDTCSWVVVSTAIEDYFNPSSAT